MSVQMQQFRVVGVKRGSGADVSVIIDAATKAAAEVKAEQMNIETTHIARLKQDDPTPPSDHELFSAEAAEALAGKRTINLIEEVTSDHEQAPPRAASPPPTPQTKPAPNPIVATITRPSYAASDSRREPAGADVSGTRAFGFVLIVLLCMTAGAYFVLVHEPNNVNADEQELVFGQDLFSDVLSSDNANPNAAVRDAFGTGAPSNAPPIAPDQQVNVNAPKTKNTPTHKPAVKQHSKLELQSVVTSHEGRFAVINGKLYKQGATIAGHTLVSVADDWVLIEKDGKQRVLQIEAN